MKNNINFLFFLAFSLLFYGCEQTVFINQNGYTPRVAIESDIMVDSVAKIFLTQTQNYYGYVDYQTPAKYIDDAKVIITSNGVSDEFTPTIGKTDTLIIYKGYDPNTGQSIYDTIFTKQKYYRGHTICKKGQSYQLKITHEGKDITSELEIPNLIFAKTEAEQKEEEMFPGSGYKQPFLEIRVKDAVGVGNYYRTKTSYTYMEYIYQYNPITGENEIVDSIQRTNKEVSQIFSDETIDGGVLKVRNYPNLYVYNISDSGYVPIFIQVECMDMASGKYWQSLYNQNGSNGDPFQEPTILYSNINKGVGFFGASQIVDTLTFLYKKKVY